jgi:hypothetical protein
VAEGTANERDLALLRAAYRLGEEIVATTGRRGLRQMKRTMAAAIGPVIYVEGLQASDGSRVTEEDNALFNWAVGHQIAAWTGAGEGSNLHH